jgi:hypothetical protein
MDKKEILKLIKYRQMWEEFKECNDFYFDNWEIRRIKFKVNEFEQKYFPKEASQDYKEGEE